MNFLLFLSITICLSFGASASQDVECVDEITFKSHSLEQDAGGTWYWQSKNDTSQTINFSDLVCVENGFRPVLPPVVHLPNLLRLGHFGDQVNYGVEDLSLPKLSSIQILLISSASYPNLEIRKVDLSSLTEGTLHLSAGNQAPHLEEIKIGRNYWENLIESDVTRSVESHCQEDTERSSKQVIVFKCNPA